eukprot:364478-Chlamydomonas_euryale.AAC.18
MPTAALATAVVSQRNGRLETSCVAGRMPPIYACSLTPNWLVAQYACHGSGNCRPNIHSRLADND